MVMMKGNCLVHCFRIRFVTERRKFLLPLLIFVLISIGFIVDISHGVRLSKLEEGHDYIRSMFDYDYSNEGVDTDILVNIDVLSKVRSQLTFEKKIEIFSVNPHPTSNNENF